MFGQRYADFLSHPSDDRVQHNIKPALLCWPVDCNSAHGTRFALSELLAFYTDVDDHWGQLQLLLVHAARLQICSGEAS